MKINLVVIKTHKIHELHAFYTLLGCQFDYHKHGKGVFHYSTNCDGIVFEIYPLPKTIVETDTTTRLGFEVENLNNLIENLKEKDITILTNPIQTEYGYVAIIEDLDGRKIELLEKQSTI